MHTVLCVRASVFGVEASLSVPGPLSRHLGIANQCTCVYDFHNVLLDCDMAYGVHSLGPMPSEWSSWGVANVHDLCNMSAL